MSETNILIVEDDYVLAYNLLENLIELGYKNIQVVHDPQKILDNLEQYNVEIALVDIHLSNNESTGIDIAKKLSGQFETSIIYLTSYTSGKLKNEALKTLPSAYLVKPVDKAQLEASLNLEQLKKEHLTTLPKSTGLSKLKDSLYVRRKNKYHRIETEGIVYLKGAGSYTLVVTDSETFTLSVSLKKSLGDLPAQQFLRCHRSYAINVDYLESFDSKYLYVQVKANTQQIPISRRYKPLIKSILKPS